LHWNLERRGLRTGRQVLILEDVVYAGVELLVEIYTIG
jgi:hypothetical protein